MFCQKCGQELNDEVLFCSKCGNKTGNEAENVLSERSASKSYEKNEVSVADNLIHELIKRIRISAIIWLSVGCLQLLIGLVTDGWYGWAIIIVGVLNIICSLVDFSYSNSLKENQSGIVEKFTPLTEYIINAGYNALCGGLIGLAGSIYDLVAVRNFVMTNKDKFCSIEEAAASK